MPTVAQEDPARRNKTLARDIASRLEFEDDYVTGRPSRRSGGVGPVIIRRISTKQIAEIEGTLYPDAKGVTLAGRWDDESPVEKLHWLRKKDHDPIPLKPPGVDLKPPELDLYDSVETAAQSRSLVPPG